MTVRLKHEALIGLNSPTVLQVRISMTRTDALNQWHARGGGDQASPTDFKVHWRRRGLRSFDADNNSRRQRRRSSGVTANIGGGKLG